MANRNFPARCVADNSSGSLPAVRNVWRHGVRRFHVGTGHSEPTSDAGYTTAGYFLLPSTPISFLLCLEGSPYMQVRPHHLPPTNASISGTNTAINFLAAFSLPCAAFVFILVHRLSPFEETISYR